MNKFNFNLICLQEVRIKQTDIKYIKNNKRGCEFVSLAKTKKRGVVIYAKIELQPKKILEDAEGRYLAIDILLERKRTLVVGIYAPNGPKENFFRKLKSKLDEENYEQMIVLGDFNGVSDIQKEKQPKKERWETPQDIF